MPDHGPLTILHLVGDQEDTGGILSVIRNLQSVNGDGSFRHVVWVQHRYQETRKPTLEYRYSRWIRAESSRHIGLILRSLPATYELLKLIRTERFDVLHAHTRGTLPVALFYSEFAKRPVLFTNHNYAKRLGLYRWTARQNRLHTVALTPNMVRHYDLDQDNPRLHTISACFGDEFLQHPLVERQDNRTAGRPVRLIGVGSIVGWKKWDLAIEAIRRLPDALRQKIEFNVWGPTLYFPEAQTYTAQLKEQTAQAGLSNQVYLRGASPRILDELRRSDLFLLPSTNEPCSVALMEALALGLPAIVSRSGGCVDIVKPGCGLHFEPDDPDSLREALEQALLAPDAFDAPARIRDSVKDRCASQVSEAYRKIWRDLAAWKTPSRDRPQIS